MGALTLDFGSLPENVTAESLAADTTFVSNVGESIAAGLGVDPSKVTITKISIVSRRLSQAEARELQGTKLKVEYELVTTSLAEPTKSSSFAAAFTTALVAKEAASGRAVTVKEIVPEAATVTSKTEVVTITQAPPTPTPTGPPAPTPTPTPATAAPTPAEESSEEEESDNGALIGGVVGGVVGAGVLGGAAYAYKKKGAQE